MAKQRYIDTKFWSDGYVSDLDPIEKFLFLYFLTNERTLISGIYELPLKYMSIETGIEKEMLEKIIKRFEKDKKIYFIDGWIIIKNFQKYQDVSNEKISKGIEIAMAKIPENVVNKVLATDTLSILYPYLPNYSNTNTNTNSNSNTNTNKTSRVKKETNIQTLINHFFQLKGWSGKDKDFYHKNKIIYARYTRPAKDLLYLCDESVDEAKKCLDKVGAWAKSRDLDWGIETIFKKWYELDLLKPKEKKPYYKGQRVFQIGNAWYVLLENGEKRQFAGEWSQIEYK